jgi:hypothetical protein
MLISGPERYELAFDAASFAVKCEKGTPRFSGIATSRKPKLYIASVNDTPVYVGVTRQPIRNRLRFGWNAAGAGGYYGYAWRHALTEAFLDIWCHDDPPSDNPGLDIEIIEAEVVFLIRAAGQWPLYQTEIHFHPSSQDHRDIAARIMARYAPPTNSEQVGATSAQTRPAHDLLNR